VGAKKREMKVGPREADRVHSAGKGSVALKNHKAGGDHDWVSARTWGKVSLA